MTTENQQMPQALIRWLRTLADALESEECEYTKFATGARTIKVRTEPERAVRRELTGEEYLKIRWIDRRGPGTLRW